MHTKFAQVTFTDIFSIPHFLLPARAILKGLVMALSRSFRRSRRRRYENHGAVRFRGKNAEKIGGESTVGGRWTPETVGNGLEGSC